VIDIGNPVTSTTEPALASFDSVLNLSLFTLLISGSSLIPGYWVSFIFIDWWGRKPIQLMGFTTLGILFLVMGTPLPMIIYMLCLNHLS